MSSSWPASETSEDDILKCVICSRDVADPVLLSCLHSACSLCTEGTLSDSLTCPTCHVTTDAPTGKTNLIVSSLAHRSLIFKSVFSCKQCSDEGDPDVVAVLWCYTCQQSLCFDCRKDQSKVHSTHKLMNLDESTNLSELYRPPARRCANHDQEVHFACFTCKSGRCSICVHDCYTSSHEVVPLDGSVALKRMDDRVTQATSLLSELNSSLTPLQDHLNLSEKVLSAREESLATLKNAKKTAIDSIGDAYDKSEESLLECWDSLLVQVFALQEGIECLNRRVSWTNEYCGMALRSNDIVGLLSQLDVVVSSLEILLEEARRFPAPVDPSKMVIINTCVPSGLNLIASEWFGQANVVPDDLNPSGKNVEAENDIDYHKRKAKSVSEKKKLQDQRKTLQKLHEQKHMTLQLELSSKTQQLDAKENEKQKLVQQQEEKQKRFDKEREQLQAELNLKTQQLVAREAEKQKLLQQQKEKQKRFDKEREQLQMELKSKTQQLATMENERKKLVDQQQEQQKQLDLEARSVEQLQSELKTKTQQIDATENENKELLDQQQQQQSQLDQERRTVEQLQTELKFATPTKPLSFDSKPLGTFKGPSSCWDVTVTPHGSLLVAAMADGLKEYDATSFREIATWKPNADRLSENVSSSVTAVEALSDGGAVVGLTLKQVVLLRRDVPRGGGGSCSGNAAEVWRVDRCVVVLQAPPRNLSQWGDRLLAVLEDRYDESTDSWTAGPGLVLLSMTDDDEQLYRQQLEYNADHVALTDRCVIVASDEQVELTDVAGSGGGSRKCYVVDCYSHVGVRLWRHEFGAVDLCSDSVGRVLYAAKQGSVVALSADDGRELRSALALSTTETNGPYALSMDKWTHSWLVLISRDGEDAPNIITIFSAAMATCGARR